MQTKEQQPALPPTMLARAEQIQREIQQLSGRDLQLWSIVILVILVLTAGMLALVLPNVIWAQRVIRVEHAYLPQLFFGLISLVLLFNIYLVGQKVTLNNTRRALISELVLNERLESLSLIDPLTQLFNRRAMNEMIPREVARANRLSSHLTFLTIDLDDFRAVNSKFGNIEGNFLLREFARLLTTSFRGGDIVFRQGGDEFLVVMPDTSEQESDAPIRRLHSMLEQWNISSGKSYQLAFSWGIAGYVTGSQVEDVLRAVDRQLYQKKHNLVPVF
ncbi:MAG TPA: GGDEF domain-containing protein [Terriglobales bacterium]|jgi:diguanylate cyclase (GGDEF)-like protein|nr:GGDEF domain-containing protein [Terriglobales bacterium]